MSSIRLQTSNLHTLQTSGECFGFAVVDAKALALMENDNMTQSRGDWYEYDVSLTAETAQSQLIHEG
jgi:hypothetical protein